MELLLWRWSTTAQITSALMLAVFFVVLGRSVRRVELRPWMYAWLANLAALLVTCIFWFAQPSSHLAFVVLRGSYFFWKTMFVVLLVAGAWSFVRRRPGPIVSRTVIVCILAYAVVGAFSVDSIDKIGVVESAVMALILGGCAGALLVRRPPGAGWLTAGLTIRALLAAVEAVAHVARIVPMRRLPEAVVGLFVASYSSFDTGAEWVIALGCVLILHRTIQQELTKSNLDLTAAQEVLQQLVDRDPLTGLANRRALPAIFRDVVETGASLLFFDLDDFKGINDAYGHQTGDECLRRFARALQAAFRPDDHVIRYAGDEFVVVAPSADAAAVRDHVERMRERLKFERAEGPPIRFSVGQAVLSPHGDAEGALKAADEAMYREKNVSGGRLRSV